MKDFINAFKKTSYYQNLIDTYEVLGIFLLGSMSTGIIDERSDYDIMVVTLHDSFEDSSRYEHLMYKGKKVHWYRNSIKDSYNPIHNSLKVLCPIQLRNLCEDLVIYENPKYLDKLQIIYKMKNELSNLGVYRLFEIRKDYVEEILRAGKILEEHHSKYLYHLCLASYYLLDEEPDKDFLRILKRIRWQPVPDDYKQLAVERLKIYKNYIEQNPLDVEKELEKLSQQLR